MSNKNVYQMKNWWSVGATPESRIENPRSTSVPWYTRDNEENFKKNKPQGYDETSISYDFNDHGFRTGNFDPSTEKFNLLFLGCSHTEGVGLRIEDTWASKVAKKFNAADYNSYNLGVAGGSIDTVTRLFANSIGSIIHPSIVFILWPPKARFDHYVQHGDTLHWDTHGPWHANKDTMFLYEDANVYNNFVRNKLLVELLAQKHVVTVVDIEIDKLFDHELPLLPIPHDRARDDHLAPSIHSYIADRFISLYTYLEQAKDAANATQ